MVVAPQARPAPPWLRSVGFWLGAFIVGVVGLAAVVGPALVPHDAFAQDLNNRLAVPVWMEGGSWTHPLGTDQLGRDYLARLVYGARISMVIGIATVITSGVIGTAMGVVGGFFGGRVDDVVLFAITCRLSIPVVLLKVSGSRWTSPSMAWWPRISPVRWLLK